MVKETCFDLIHITDGIIELHGIRFQGNLGFIFFVGKLLPKLLGAVAVVVGVLLGVVQDQPTARECTGNGLWGHLGAQDTRDVGKGSGTSSTTAQQQCWQGLQLKNIVTRGRKRKYFSHKSISLLCLLTPSVKIIPKVLPGVGATWLVAVTASLASSERLHQTPPTAGSATTGYCRELPVLRGILNIKALTGVNS